MTDKENRQNITHSTSPSDNGTGGKNFHFEVRPGGIGSIISAFIGFVAIVFFAVLTFIFLLIAAIFTIIGAGRIASAVMRNAQKMGNRDYTNTSDLRNDPEVIDVDARVVHTYDKDTG